MREIRAQLEAMHPALGGRERCIQRLDGRLEQDSHSASD
jgi:hypothetical protein